MNMNKKFWYVLLMFFSFFFAKNKTFASNDVEVIKAKYNSKYYAIRNSYTESCSSYTDLISCTSHFIKNKAGNFELCTYLMVLKDKSGSGNNNDVSKQYCTSSVDDSCITHDVIGASNCSTTTNSEHTKNCIISSVYQISSTSYGEFSGGGPLLSNFPLDKGKNTEEALLKYGAYSYISIYPSDKINKNIKTYDDFRDYLMSNKNLGAGKICLSNGNQYTEQEKAEVEKENPGSTELDEGKIDKERNEVYNPEDEEKDLGLEEWNQKKCSELSDSDCKKRQDCQMVGGTCSDAEIAKDPCNEKSIRQVLKFFGYLLMIAKFVVPFILIGFAVYDLYKSIIDKDEKALKTKLRMIMFRIIAGVTVFFVPDLVWVGFKYIEKSNITGDQYQVCAECVLKPSSNELCTVEDNSTNE